MFAGWRPVVPGGEGEGRRGGEDGDQSSRWRRFCFAAAALAPKPDSAHFLASGGGCLQMGAGSVCRETLLGRDREITSSPSGPFSP